MNEEITNQREVTKDIDDMFVESWRLYLDIDVYC